MHHASASAQLPVCNGEPAHLLGSSATPAKPSSSAPMAGVLLARGARSEWQEEAESHIPLASSILSSVLRRRVR